jgi:NAD(P)H dehydrogenase (quinone)
VQRLMVEYLGMEALEPFVAYAAPRVDQATREAYLEGWRARMSTITAQTRASAVELATAAP